MLGVYCQCKGGLSAGNCGQVRQSHHKPVGSVQRYVWKSECNILPLSVWREKGNWLRTGTGPEVGRWRTTWRRACIRRAGIRCSANSAGTAAGNCLRRPGIPAGIHLQRDTAMDICPAGIGPSWRDQSTDRTAVLIGKKREGASAPSLNRSFLYNSNIGNSEKGG